MEEMDRLPNREANLSLTDTCFIFKMSGHSRASVFLYDWGGGFVMCASYGEET